MSPAPRKKIKRLRGVTLLEVLVALTILALISTLIYGAFDGMSRSKDSLAKINERHHQGRSALARIARELQSAFVSGHEPILTTSSTRTTIFKGQDSRPADRIDFTSFSHRRLLQDAKESDQNEISYYDSRDPDRSDKVDLVRREDKIIDLDPDKGGVVNVVAEDIESFELEYYDPISKDWTDTWDSGQPAAQFGRLPMFVRVSLEMKGPNSKPILFQTKVHIPGQSVLCFASAIPGQCAPKSN